MATPPTFTIETRSHLSEPNGIYDFAAVHVLPNDMIRWKADGQTHVARVCETYKALEHMTYVYGYIKSWDKRGRRIRKGKRRLLVGIPSGNLVDCIGRFDF